MSFGARRGMSRMLDSAGRETPPIAPERRAQTVRRIIGFFRPYRLAVAAVLATIVVTSLLGLVNPYLLKLLIDVAIPQRDFALLTAYVALMIVIPIVSGLIGVGQSYMNNIVGQRVMHAGPAQCAVHASPAHAVALLHGDAHR
jgi:ABC-type bacteriocin/lantibiotic exporter with double-glycine peptidase domain